jgi:hypothetical protein
VVAQRVGRRGAARTAGVVAGVALLVGGGAYAWHWHTHPAAFPDAGNAWSGALREGTDFMAVGVTDSGPGAGETVVIESVAPRVRTDTAGARYEFFVCTQLSDQPGTQLGMLSGQRNFDRHCPDAEPVRDGTRLRTGGTPAQQLVMVVRMDRAGVAATRGVELTYSRGLQSGTQLVGPRVRLRSAG